MNFYIVRRGGQVCVERHEEVHFVKGGWLWKDGGNGQTNRGEILEVVEGLWPGRRDDTVPANVLHQKEGWEATLKVMES